MNKYIILLNDDGMIKLNEVVEELKENGCIITGTHKNIGVVSFDSPKTMEELNKLRISGVESIDLDRPASIQTK